MNGRDQGSEEEKGFKVEDKRKFGPGGERKEGAGEERPEEPKEEKKPRFHAPSTGPAEVSGGNAAEEETLKEGAEEYAPIDFKSFLVSQSYVVHMYLGDTPNPQTKKTEVNLPAARQMIEFIGMIKEKTKGNLDKEEESLFETLMYQLRLRYVEKTKQKPE